LPHPTIEEASVYLFMSTTRFRQLQRENVLPRTASSDWTLDGIRRRYIEHLRAVKAGYKPMTSGNADDLKLDKERARLTKEQADKAELDNASLRKELVARFVLETGLAGMDASLKDRLMMVPTSAAPEALSAGEVAGSPGIAEVYRRHIGQALSDVASAKVVSSLANDH
jgi:hypothetical protein